MIMVNGKDVAVQAPVRVDTDLQFRGLALRTETRAVVLHWTGGRGLAPQVFRTVRGRGLSVHFTIDPDGTIYQFCDASLRCSHAGVANSWSVGIEIVNPARPALAGADRRLVSEKIHGKGLRYCSFTEPQITSALELTAALCRAYGLPMRAPSDATVLGPVALRSFRGVLGHLHVSRAKIDPGLELLRLVNERWQA